MVKEVRATASAPDEVTRLRRGANQTGAADLSVIMTAYEEQESRGRDPTERPVRSGAGVLAGRVVNPGREGGGCGRVSLRE